MRWQVKLSPAEKIRRYFERRRMRNHIEREIGNLYFYKGRKFTSMKDALEYKDLVKFVKNEKELNKEWKTYTKTKRLKLIEKLWKEE